MILGSSEPSGGTWADYEPLVFLSSEPPPESSTAELSTAESSDAGILDGGGTWMSVVTESLSGETDEQGQVSGEALTESLSEEDEQGVEQLQASLTYEQLFRSVADVYDLDWRLLAAVAYRESRFNPLAVGSQGELGLMQILPSTWQSLAPAEADPFDPVTNVHVGAMYLARLHRRAWAASYWAVVAYNWGPSNVNRLLSRGGGWGDLPRVRQGYAVDVFDLIADDESGMWQALNGAVP